MTDTNLGRDPAAFEAFYRRNVRSVSGFVARRLTDPQLVDDLTTEVFLAAIEGADSYRPSRGSESAWLLGIARNVLAAERRTAARRVDKMLRAGGRRPLDADDKVLRRALRPVLALATAATAVAVGLTVTSGGGIPAFAVTEASDGTVTITITDYRDTAQLTAELKRLDLPAAVVYVPADEYCYQAHADLVRQPANGQFTVGFGAIGSKTGITITFRTRLLRPGQSIIFGIGDYVRNGVVLDAAGTYVVTGQPTSCQYHSSDRLVFPAPGPGHSAPPATKAPVIAYVDGNVRFPNSLGLSGK